MAAEFHWPDGKRICCTFRVAYEAFRQSGRFKKSPKMPLNVASLSHANLEGARLKRVPFLMRPFALLPEPNPRDLRNGRWSAVARFDRD